MRQRLALVLLAILASAGCDTVLTSSQLPPIREDALLGEWKDLGTAHSKPDPDPVVFKFTDGQYWVGSPDQFAKGKASAFTLARVGSALIAQSSSTQCDEFEAQKGKPCWSLDRVELVGSKMNWYEFDAKVLERDSLAGALKIGHIIHRQSKPDGQFNNTILLTGESQELKLFLESYVKRRSAFHLTGRLERIH